jgi:hypothetical protein
MYLGPPTDVSHILALPPAELRNLGERANGTRVEFRTGP